MADIHGSPGAAPQMPSADGPGPAPVPYGGADVAPEPPDYGVALGADAGGVTTHVLAGVTGLNTTESAAAHDVAAGTITPYYPGTPDPIYTGGDADAGGRDDVAASVAAAVGNAEARWQEFASDTYQQGSTIGDLMTLPANSMDPAVGVQGPEGAFYDPPRNY